MSTGAIYVITQDERYLNLLRTSVESLKCAMPDLPITVFSQFPVECECLDRVVPIKTAGDGFYDKARLMLDSPYDRTIFIDADIYIVEPFPELFTLLDRFDCAATHEEYLNTDWSNNHPRLPRVYVGRTVYEQKVSGELWSDRKAHKAGSFPEPESVFMLRARRLNEIIHEQGMRQILGKLLFRK